MSTDPSRVRREPDQNGEPATASTPVFDADLPWKVHPQVSLRREPFGALAYHFGTRRLSFLKTPTLLAVVESLGTEPSARAACATAGVTAAERRTYEQALATLSRTGMICRRESAP